MAQTSDSMSLATIQAAMEADAVQAMSRSTSSSSGGGGNLAAVVDASGLQHTSRCLLAALHPLPQRALEQLKELNAPPLRCGRVFAESEPTYTCWDCASDTTCVFCHSCFMVSQHKTHRYSEHISGGGGTCDCGDEEAWKQYPCCENHTRRPEDVATPGQIVARIDRKVLDALYVGVQSLLRLSLDLFDHNRPEWNISHERASTYAAVLYNDEQHTFDDVISTLRSALNCNSAVAQRHAVEVDTYGRSIIRAGREDACTRVAAHVVPSALTCRVELMGQLYLQEVAVNVFEWLAQQAKEVDILRAIVCACACDMSIQQLIRDQVVLEKSPRWVAKALRSYTNFWKRPRQAFRHLLFNSLLIEPLYKPTLAADYLFDYEHILYSSVGDGQSDDEAITQLSVQLFTVHSIARLLAENYNGLVHIGAILKQWTNDLLTENGKLKLGDIVDESVLGSSRFSTVIYDISYILQASIDSRVLLSATETFLQFVSRLQGMDAESRARQVHVEFELEDWKTAYMIGIPLSVRLLSSLVKSLAVDIETIQGGLQLICQAILSAPDAVTAVDLLRTPEGIEVVKGMVSEEPMSFHWPLQRFFTHLAIEATQKDRLLDVRQLFHGAPNVIYHAVLDPALRSLSFAAQIECTLWIRNGINMFHRLQNYRSGVASDWMFLCDLSTVQLCAVAMGIPQVVAAARRRFELDELLQSVVPPAPSALRFELQAMLSIQERFFDLLLHLYTHRFWPGLAQASDEDACRYHAVQSLAAGPLPFSVLAKNFSVSERRDPLLSSQVKHVASFNVETRTYELKPEYLSWCDPYYVERPPTETARCLEYLTKRQAAGAAFEPPPALPNWCEPLQALNELPSCDRVLGLMFTVLARAVGGVAGEEFLNDNTVSTLVTDRLVGVCLRLITVALVQDGAEGMENATARALLSYFSPDGMSFCAVLGKLYTSDKLEASLQPQLRWIQSTLMAAANEAQRRILLQCGFTHQDNDAKKPKTMKGKNKAKARQAKLLAQFAKMQASFQTTQKMEDEEDEEFKTPPESTTSFPPAPGADADVAAAASGAAAVSQAATSAGGVATAADSDTRKPATTSTISCLQCHEEGDLHTDRHLFVMPAQYHRAIVLRPPNRPESPANNGSEAASQQMRWLMDCSTPADGEIYFSTCTHALHWTCWAAAHQADLAQPASRWYSSTFTCDVCRSSNNFLLPALDVDVQPTHLDLDSDYDSLQEALSMAQGLPLSAAEEWKPTLAGGAPLPGLSRVDREEVDHFQETLNDKLKPSMCWSVDNDISRTNNEANHHLSLLLWRMLGQTVASIEFADTFSAEKRVVAPTTLKGLHQLLAAARASIVLESQSSLQAELAIERERLTSVLWDLQADDRRLELVALAHDPYSALVSTTMLLFMDADVHRPAAEARPVRRLPWRALCQMCLELSLLTTMMELVEQSTVPTAAGDAHDRHMASSEDCEALVALSRKLQSVAAEYAGPGRCDTWRCDVFGDPSVVNLVVDRSWTLLRRAYLLQKILEPLMPEASVKRIPGTLSEMAAEMNLPSFADLTLALCSRLESDTSCSSRVVRAMLDRQAIGRMWKTPQLRTSFVPLPHEYSELLLKSQSALCPSLQTPSKSPALCLLCGSIVCFQSMCCSQRMRIAESVREVTVGGCTQHARSCGAGWGMFILIRSGLLIATNDRGASFSPVPYVDEHGEHDIHLRRGCRTELSTSELSRLWQRWVSHQVFNIILNATQNTGRNPWPTI